MPEPRIPSSSSSDSPFQLLLRQRLIIRCLVQAHKTLGGFNPNFVGSSSSWDSLIKLIHPAALIDLPIAGLTGLTKGLQQEFLMECGQATARAAHTRPLTPELFDVKTPADYLLPGLLANRSDLTSSALSFPSAYPPGIQSANHWQEFWRRYCEAMSHEFWIWFVQQKPLSMTSRDVWRAFGKAARTAHAEWAPRVKAKSFFWRASSGNPSPAALRQTLYRAYSSHRQATELVDGWLYYQVFNQFLIDLGETSQNTAEYIALLDQFMSTAVPTAAEEELLRTLVSKPAPYDVVLTIRMRSPLNPFDLPTKHLPFSFKKAVYPGRKIKLQIDSPGSALVHFPNVPLRHGSDAAGYCIPLLRSLMDQVSYLAKQGIDWQLVLIHYRPKGARPNVHWGAQRFDSPIPIDTPKLQPSLRLLAKVVNRGDDAARRCELALKYWAQAHLSTLDDESSFLNLWAIVDILNPKAAKGRALELIMPVYWLQQKFPGETPAIIEKQYLRVKEYFRTLWGIRSRGVIHRSQVSWEPRALAIWTTVLRDYIAGTLAGLIHHLLNCKKCRPPAEILPVISCMLDRAILAGLPTSYRPEVVKEIT